MKLDVNGSTHDLDIEADTPLLWAIREGLKLTGTKYACGIAQCGSCIVLVDGKPMRSCITPVSSVAGKKITTIEGLSDDRSHPVQQAWIEIDVPQCGYCQSGQIMAAEVLLRANPNPSDEEITAHMTGNLCRCMAYPRIHRAIKSAATGGEQQSRSYPGKVTAGVVL